MITRNYLKVHKEGVGKNKVTPVFPKVIFFSQEGINLNKNDPCYDLKQIAIDCAVERIYPDWVSLPLNKKVTGANDSATTCMG
jgi:ribonucleoside-triphosphate reductase